MSNFISIDFGMQNLKVCYYDGRKCHRVDLEGNQQSESKASKNAVYYTDDESGSLLRYFFGAEEAETARKYLSPDYVCYIKRELQKEHYSRSVCNGRYCFSALKITTDIFKQIFTKMTEARYDISAPTILTVPVIFSEIQKAMLRCCAEKAGFCVQEIISEPFAALFSEQFFDECIEKIDGSEYVLILDLGASTFDFCLLNVQHESDLIEVKALSSAGISYGGKDITDALTAYLMNKYEDLSLSIISAGRLDEDTLQPAYFELTEDLKSSLYEEKDTAEFSRSFYGSKVNLKTANVDAILDDSKIWSKIEYIILNMIEETDEIDAEDISKVIMTGGTSKIQYFRDRVEALFNEAKLICDPENPDSIFCAVSSGAINYAVQESATVSNSLPMSFGIDVGNGFESVLNRNSFFNVPGKRKQLSRSCLEKNNWRIRVYQTMSSVASVREHSDVKQEGFLYAGYIQLDPNKYSQDGDICLLFKYTKYGLVASTTYIQDLKQYIDDGVLLSTEVQYE